MIWPIELQHFKELNKCFLKMGLTDFGGKVISV